MDFKTPFKIAAKGALAPVTVNQNRQAQATHHSWIPEQQQQYAMVKTMAPGGLAVLRALLRFKGCSGSHKGDDQIIP